ncbi:ATP-dependent DNA helicase RecQ-like [Saccostrea echinata]|uniref:ATP-dependent DNA helicase RecQ-like n=1 Tax=Saccostrea echinata TaxID=191078 RepID=UPI002A8010B7|nr:ATP-dependent DNA helicase RecQ-like [Saccostrea echinata]
MNRELIDDVVAALNLPFKLKDLQLECLKAVADGKDLFAVLPTGYGKSVLYTVLPKLLWESKVKVRCSTGVEHFSSVVIVISPLISLMKDQVLNIKSLGVDCAYIGEKQEGGELMNIKNGKVPVLLMSPESLFSGSWRQVLETDVIRRLVSAIVVDEAHCVEQWGDEFRTDYSRINELRSILPEAVMVALTATATLDSRIKISKMLGMNSYHTVIGCCNRENIMYFAKKASYDIEENFQWLIDELKLKKSETPKVIIYCRNIKTCSIIYSLFRRKLGANDSYIGQSSARNCLYAMFHHSTPDKNKQIISENFRQPDGKLRVVIATNAFGMGINVKDIHKVIHWGAPKSVNGFMQESGRAGRDNSPSQSIVYYHPIDVSVTATDDQMRQYCKLKSCRRHYLILHFSPENMKAVQGTPKHFCCDNCAISCDCQHCPVDFYSFFPNEDDSIVMAAAGQYDDNKSYRTITDEKRETLTVSLHEMRKSLLQSECYEPTILPAEILTGLSDTVIKNIVSNAHYMFDIDDIYGEYVYDKKTAEKILKVIDEACTHTYI